MKQERKNISMILLAGYTRYLILMLSVLCMTIVRSNEMLFNLTVICMTDNNTSTRANISKPIMLSPDDNSIIFASSVIGVAIFSLPVAHLLYRFGMRIIFTVLMFISGLATAVMPEAAHLGLPIIVCARIFQGLALATVMPMIGYISSHWAPFSELGLFVTVLSMTGQTAQMFTMPLAAHFCMTIGWPYAFYNHALLSLFLAVASVLLYRDSPAHHPFVSKEEYSKITEGNKIREGRDIAVPYRSIVSSASVWAVWIAFFGNSFGFQFIVRCMPIYFNKVLGTSIGRTGLLAVVPPASQLAVKLILSVTADHINCFSKRLKLQIFNTLSMVGCGLWLLPLGFLKPKDDMAALVCFTVSVSCVAFEACGSMNSATLIAGDFTQFVMAVAQLLSTVGMLLVPFLVGWLAPNNTSQEWNFVVLTIAAVHLLANVAFCALCNDKPEQWALTDMDASSSNQSRLESVHKH